MRYTVFRWFIVCILLVSIVGCDGTSNKMRLRKRNQITEVLIEAINDNNTDRIYNLFSEDIRKSDAKLLLQIKDICNYFDSMIESYDYRGGGQSDQYNEEDTTPMDEKWDDFMSYIHDEMGGFL